MKVYLGDDKPYNIVSKSDVAIRLPNGTMWKLNDVRHVPCLKRNLISVSQLASMGCTITFSNDAWKVTKGASVLARGKKEGTLYMTMGSGDTVSVAKSSNESNLWQYRLGHMNEKGMKVLLSKGKLQNLKLVEIDFCEDCVFRK